MLKFFWTSVRTIFAAGWPSRLSRLILKVNKATKTAYPHFVDDRVLPHVIFASDMELQPHKRQHSLGRPLCHLLCIRFSSRPCQPI